jgi:hypothetical protein
LSQGQPSSQGSALVTAQFAQTRQSPGFRRSHLAGSVNSTAFLGTYRLPTGFSGRKAGLASGGRQLSVSGLPVNQPSGAWEESLIECASVNTGRVIRYFACTRTSIACRRLPRRVLEFGSTSQLTTSLLARIFLETGYFCPSCPQKRVVLCGEGPRSQGFRRHGRLGVQSVHAGTPSGAILGPRKNRRLSCSDVD